ncbi:glycoside hydrolase family 76 protein [Mucilaginibacter flavus]|uniref:glycoside hydrolase family 76 protein n=1 Tax=Mucilaginibacter flavus TaxID=931504 RepID=UPI0025B3F2C4|nr:glycoside hydrolase family 76 protein [Mucilaginibacter flavus]MDN3582779.1 glycoside hydrolase family 76 protein [Mucilaginibacter flavus]
MKNIILTLCIGVFFALQASAQTVPDYKTRIAIINKNIYDKFYDAKENLYFETNDSATNKGNHSFLWPLCALVQAANEMETGNPSKSYIAPVMKAIEQYYSTKPPVPGYQAMVVKEKVDSRFYDDNEWIAIALMDAYARNHKKEYLTISQTIYRFLLSGHDMVGGGGFYWVESDKKGKNTCSNGPAILVALQLYKATHQKAYLDTAIVTYNWAKQYLLSSNGIYYDAIKVPSMKVDSAYYTYNAGTMLQAGVILYNITKDKTYLDDAESVAKASEQHFYNNGRLPGNYWFNAVLLRGYIELYKVDKDKKQLQFIVDDADRTWLEEKDDKNLLGLKKVKALIDQAAMLEIYARLENLKLK